MEVPIAAFNGQSASAWAPALPGEISVSSPIAMSDILVVRAPPPSAAPVALTADMTNTTDSLQVDPATLGINTGDVLMAFNCQARAFFQVSGFAAGTIQHAAGGASPGNATADLQRAFAATIQGELGFVIPFESRIYFVAPSTAGTSNALWRRRGAGAAQELVEGVDDFQLRFGMDTDSNLEVDSYVTADGIGGAWQNILSVQVALLVRSMDTYGNTTDTGTYTLLDRNAGPYNDRRIRKVFTSTVALRNQVM
jgi:type IV pilus assembly protein PilW